MTLPVEWFTRSPRVVALGGGTGLPVVLRGLKEALFPRQWRRVPGHGRDRLTGIVTVADDGGSSGRLRRAYRIAPPGDIRNCLLALADGDPTLSSLFGYRFDGHDGVAGHSLGNLILAALSTMEHQLPRAVERASEMLATRGRVYPATIDDVVLAAQLEDGSLVQGESRIGSAPARIERVRMLPETARAWPQALEALASADLVVIGPGSLYTSLVPNLLVREVAETLASGKAHVVVVMNLMTERETRGLTAADHILALRRQAPQVPIHDVLMNDTPIPDELQRRYAAAGGIPIVPDADAVSRLGCRPVLRGLLGPGPKLRHDAEALASALLDLAAEVPQCVGA